MAHVRALSETIGPRKTGTPGETKAREYVAAEMARIGLSVRRIPVARVGSALVGSENIIGVLPGRVADAILIGSHFDSRAASVPGANDDASAVAVMLETARVLAAAPPVSTLVFASFCAEEEGLLGATHYAQTEDLSRLKLVVNMDPVGQREIFISPFPVAPPLWANRALASVARRGAIPGVISDPLYLLVTRSLKVPFGADHEPFRDKGVPALSLSDRFRVWTYHTVEDRVEWIDPQTLESAGRSVLGLVRMYDDQPPAAGPAGGPAGDDPTYVVVPVAGRALFVVTRAIQALALLVIVAAALWWRTVGWKAWRRGWRLTRSDAGRAVARAGLPLAGAILGALLSEALSQALSGYRYSWTSHQGLHLAQAGAWAVAGLALGWMAAAKRPGPDEPDIYMVLGAGLCALAGFAPMAAGRPDIGFYFLLPAAATLGAAALRPDLAGAGMLAGYLPLLGLVTPGAYADAVAFVNLSVPAWVSGPALWLLGLPLALGLARTLASPAFALRGARAAGRAARWLALAGAACGAGLLGLNLTLPAYDATHRRIVRAVETVDLNATGDARASLRLGSPDHLRGVRTNQPGNERLDLRITRRTLPVAPPAWLGADTAPAVTVEKAEAAGDDARDLKVVALPPVTLDGARVTLRSTDTIKLLDDGVWVARNEFVRRHVYASDAFSESFRLSGRPGQTVEVEIRLEFTQDILGARVEADDAVVQWTASIVWHGTVAL